MSSEARRNAGRRKELPSIVLGRSVIADQAFSREWLSTNGIGGYASGTVSGANTRRYHGLLTAATDPPVGRTLLISKLDATAIVHGGSFELDCNEFADGTVSPRGYERLESFRLEGLVPVWTWAVSDALIERRVWMIHGSNATCVRYSLIRSSDPIDLFVRVLATARDHHWHTTGKLFPNYVESDSLRLAWGFGGGSPGCVVSCEEAAFEVRQEDWWQFYHREESERGLDSREDLFSPGNLRLTLVPGQSATIVCSTVDAGAIPKGDLLVPERRRQASLVRNLKSQPGWIRQLVLAADQFIVRRDQDLAPGSTVIAGYPWFGDWGRDTMISIPGLTIATGRWDVARNVLITFLSYIDRGMLPNRFPDSGGDPEYNTADATLWLFNAIHEYLRATNDEEFVRISYPKLRDVIDWHRRGTRYGIRVDEDGLIVLGAPGVQLTWMDAKVGDWVVTPRDGKPVEINALWYNALMIMADLAMRAGEAAEISDSYLRDATQVASSIREKFWNAETGCLFDVVDAPAAHGKACNDPSIRPNQLFAVSLPFSALKRQEAASIVDVCARRLYTTRGLRSLDPDHPAYEGRYVGGPARRDGAYHQGTVWSWLLGPFVSAHYRVHNDAEAARAWLSPMEDHLSEAGIGTVSELFHGNPPHSSCGCVAQAWSVAEILRAWFELAGSPRSIGVE